MTDISTCSSLPYGAVSSSGKSTAPLPASSAYYCHSDSRNTNQQHFNPPSNASPGCGGCSCDCSDTSTELHKKLRG